MGHSLSSKKRRRAVMTMPVEDLAGWHLFVHRPTCRQDRHVALDGLIERFGGEATLARLRNRYPVHPGPPLVEVVLKGPRAFLK